MAYVDGFVVPVPKNNLEKYREMATLAGKIWREHGALEYRECIADDVPVRSLAPQSVILKDDETVVFSRSQVAPNDEVNAKVMSDPRMASMMDPKACRRRQAHVLRWFRGSSRGLTQTRCSSRKRSCPRPARPAISRPCRCSVASENEMLEQRINLALPAFPRTRRSDRQWPACDGAAYRPQPRAQPGRQTFVPRNICRPFRPRPQYAWSDRGEIQRASCHCSLPARQCSWNTHLTV